VRTARAKHQQKKKAQQIKGKNEYPDLLSSCSINAHKLTNENGNNVDMANYKEIPDMERRSKN
jgi:hypothetical protein